MGSVADRPAPTDLGGAHRIAAVPMGGSPSGEDFAEEAIELRQHDLPNRVDLSLSGTHTGNPPPPPTHTHTGRHAHRRRPPVATAPFVAFGKGIQKWPASLPARRGAAAANWRTDGVHLMRPDGLDARTQAVERRDEPDEPAAAQESQAARKSACAAAQALRLRQFVVSAVPRQRVQCPAGQTGGEGRGGEGRGGAGRGAVEGKGMHWSRSSALAAMRDVKSPFPVVSEIIRCTE